MELGKVGLPRITADALTSSSNDYTLRLFHIFYNALDSTEHGQEILLRLQASDDVAALKDVMIRRGGGATRFDIKTLAAWWLWRANEVGTSQADCDLEVFLSSDCIDVFGVLWVYGVTTEQTQKLTEEIALVSVKEMCDSNDKEYILNSKLHRQVQPGVELLPGAALVKRYKSSKILKDAESSISIADTASGDIDVRQQLFDISLLLNCLPGVCCASGYSTSYCPPEVPLGPFGGSGGGKPIRDTIPLRESRLELEDEAMLAHLIPKYQALPPSTKRRLERALLRFSQAKGRVDAQDKALDLGIALEMLLLNNEHNRNELPGQLNLHFRLRGAWLIGKTAAERQDIFELLGKVYSWRSQVAHNGFSDELSGSKSLTLSDVSEKLGECFETAERIFRALIVGETPEWRKLILGFDANQDC